MTTSNDTNDINENTNGARILVPIDFSDCSAEVVAEAISAARGIDGQLVLLHVIDLPDGATDRTPVGEQSALASLEQEAAPRLREHLNTAQEAGVQASTLIVRGNPARAILNALANDGQIKQIVMGTHGRAGVSRWLLGSVANRVMRRSPVPVQIVRFERKPQCGARSCAWCPSHVTNAQKQLAAELDG